MPARTNVVVVGVDGSAEGFAALRWANSYAVLTGSHLRVVASWMWPTTHGAVFAYDGFTPEADAQEVLEKACAELTVPQEDLAAVRREGGAGRVLVAESGDAEMLVVGCHGHTAIG